MTSFAENTSFNNGKKKINLGVEGETPIKSYAFRQDLPPSSIPRASPQSSDNNDNLDGRPSTAPSGVLMDTPAREQAAERRRMHYSQMDYEQRKFASENTFSSPEARPSTSRNVAKPSPEMFADYVVPSPTSDLSMRPEILRFQQGGEGEDSAKEKKNGAVTPPITDQYVPVRGQLKFDFEEDAESSSGYISQELVEESDEEGLEDNIFFPDGESDGAIEANMYDNTAPGAVSELEMNYAMQGRVLLSIALSL